jgi:hypothetical protein
MSKDGIASVVDFRPMKNLPLIISVVALVIAIWALLNANTALTRLEEFGLRPR